MSPQHGPWLTAFDRRPVESRRSWSMVIAAGLAVVGHAILILVAVLNLERTIGAEGTEEGVAVELVDAATLDRSSRALTGGQDTADIPSRPAPRSEPQAATPQHPAERQAPPREQPQQPQPPAPQEASQPSPRQPQQRAAKSGATQQFPDVLASQLESSFQVPRTGGLDLDAKLPSVGKAATAPRPQPQANATQSPLERYLDRRTRAAGAAAAGQTDEFTRAISRIVESNKPPWSGAPGTVVVEFVITPNGELEGLKLVQSSGNTGLDQVVMQSIRRGRYISPPDTASLRDRTFEITFKYQ